MALQYELYENNIGHFGIETQSISLPQPEILTIKQIKSRDFNGIVVTTCSSVKWMKSTNHRKKTAILHYNSCNPPFCSE